MSMQPVIDGLAAGAVAGTLSGVPSTAWALVRGHDPLEAVRAAGTLVLPRGGPVSLLVVGGLAHAVISSWWGVVLSATLPRRRTVAWGATAGLAIAALDLGLLGGRLPRIRALSLVPQVADHLAFGAVIGAVLARRRR